MTQSLVPQVKQLNRAQIEEHLETNVVPLEEARKHDSFNIGEGVNHYVQMFWELSECIKDEGLTPVNPFCMHSQGDDGEWNFSWGLDNPLTDESTRSCFYTFFPNGSVKCRDACASHVQTRLHLSVAHIPNPKVSGDRRTHCDLSCDLCASRNTRCWGGGAGRSPVAPVYAAYTGDMIMNRPS